MCDCVPSTPTHSIIATPKLRRISTTISPLKTINITNNGGFQILTPRLKPKSCIKVSKSESYELYEESGFKEIETQIRDETIRAGEKRSSDIFGLKNDFSDENEKIETLEDEEQLVQVESFSKNGDSRRLEEVGEIVDRRELRKGRQVVRRSNVLAKQVISVQSALSLGFVSQLWVDTCSWVVLVVEVRPSMLSGEMERFLLKDVCQVGDVVLVEDESVLEEDIKMLGLDTLVGYNIVTPSRRNIGKVRGFTFNINSGAVELLELDSFGISIIPSSLVSTYALFVEDVIDVESDTVVVHEAAASRLQRLTKGFWDASYKESFKDQLDEYPDLERGPIQSNSRRNRQKFTSTVAESEDDLQLPMDYL